MGVSWHGYDHRGRAQFRYECNGCHALSPTHALSATGRVSDTPPPAGWLSPVEGAHLCCDCQHRGVPRSSSRPTQPVGVAVFGPGGATLLPDAVQPPGHAEAVAAFVAEQEGEGDGAIDAVAEVKHHPPQPGLLPPGGRLPEAELAALPGDGRDETEEDVKHQLIRLDPGDVVALTGSMTVKRETLVAVLQSLGLRVGFVAGRRESFALFKGNLDKHSGHSAKLEQAKKAGIIVVADEEDLWRAIGRMWYEYAVVFRAARPGTPAGFEHWLKVMGAVTTHQTTALNELRRLGAEHGAPKGPAHSVGAMLPVGDGPPQLPQDVGLEVDQATRDAVACALSAAEEAFGIEPAGPSSDDRRAVVEALAHAADEEAF